MAARRRSGRLTMAASTGSVVIGLGSGYAYVRGLEVKGDDVDVDNNATFAITDADGRIVLTAAVLDGGTDDSTVKRTSQTFSTVGVFRGITGDEANFLSQDGSAVTDNQGAAGGVFAKSPCTVACASGTSGDVYEIALHVEG